MTDFQELILEELRSIKDGQKRLEQRQIRNLTELLKTKNLYMSSLENMR